ncbi:outer membrane beta-barrel protein [Aquirufa ecclesiirivi]|uniref:PorT family protein n=1 Tax=Aquirufa ecclesiirivi TaxID=2715124 RepID=A0ABT4JCG1_9BACT|nr:outer membrane beta-barrel protein [Aquirufa ecclesiirivi]MCZ2472346.1 PorT family protein [Aquirufa ecclesiirivi]MCZ2473975.1 PorT family protein [Aquirufa ecclesiirivi]NHC48730.1 PorT family protein [Aquirufa ecclesiirivi]
MKKSMKFSLLFLFLSGMIFQANAQFGARKVTGSLFRFGIKGGITLSSINVESMTYKGASVPINEIISQNLALKTGYVGGVYARVGRKLFIEPEVLVTAKNATINVTSLNKMVDVAYTSLDVPILLGYKLGPLHVLAGPVASYNLNSDNTIAQAITTVASSASVRDAISKAYFSYTVGGGLDLLGLTLDLRYEGNLTDLSNTVPIPSDVNISQKASVWHLTLGIKIL